jgi:hypothetical protein
MNAIGLSQEQRLHEATTAVPKTTCVPTVNQTSVILLLKFDEATQNKFHGRSAL